MKLIFMGTPDFAVPTLRKLIEAGHEIRFAVTQPDRARNRKQVTFSPVKQAALEYGIEVLQPERLKDSEEDRRKIRDYRPDAVIVVAYGQILKQDVLDIPRYGCFNVHGSLLPQLRGAAPMQRAILNGLEKTGVTIMRMEQGLDSGDMIAKAETEVDHKNFEQLHDELSVMGADLLAATLPKIESGEAVYTKQKDEEATFAPMLKKQDGKIDFSRDPRQIERQIRAFDPWPGAFCTYGEKTLKIWRAECPDARCELPPGTVTSVHSDSIDISCGGKLLRVTELQLPGKRRTAAADFLRGHKILPGDVLK